MTAQADAGPRSAWGVQREQGANTMTETATILAYRMDYRSGSASEWYCPTCHAELEDPEAGTDHIQFTAITDVADLPEEPQDLMGLRRCDGDCGRFLATGKTLFEMAG